MWLECRFHFSDLSVVHFVYQYVILSQTRFHMIISKLVVPKLAFHTSVLSCENGRVGVSVKIL
jgi:hypothetical protein